jgi:hypothetical protein
LGIKYEGIMRRVFYYEDLFDIYPPDTMKIDDVMGKIVENSKQETNKSNQPIKIDI